LPAGIGLWFISLFDCTIHANTVQKRWSGCRRRHDADDRYDVSAHRLFDGDGELLAGRSERGGRAPHQRTRAPCRQAVVATGQIILGGQPVYIDGLKALLGREAESLHAKGKTEGDATIIIRAHMNCPTGKVQEVIKACQEARFERFALRAQEKT
jgi:hypothetical protein